MKASELIAKLREQIAAHGDLEVTLSRGLGTVAVVNAYDDDGRSLKHDDPGAQKPTRIHLH
jgi:hypothetical protein